MEGLNIAVVGATGIVGSTFIRIMEERNIPIKNLYPLASARSAGRKIELDGREWTVQALRENSFDEDIDVCFFSAGGHISKVYAPLAAKKGCIVIDNSSVFRLYEDIPLVIPEVNLETLAKHKGIIANPNCATAQAAVVLKPLHDAYTLKRVVYSTYQAVSGAGQEGVMDLRNETFAEGERKKFIYPIAFNIIPHIDEFDVETGYTGEELKQMSEMRKVLGLPNLPITVTAVRVPVMNGHSESINIEFEKEFDLEDVKTILERAKGVKLYDNISKNIYPMPLFVDGKDPVFVGRVRRDFSLQSGLNMFVSADNLRKGAALNAVQILENL